jgi:hypothetical protein
MVKQETRGMGEKSANIQEQPLSERKGQTPEFLTLLRLGICWSTHLKERKRTVT